MPPPLRRTLGAFALDVLLALALFVALSLLGGIVWGVARTAQLALDGRLSGDPQAITAALGQPGVLATIGITVLGVGGTAVAMWALRARRFDPVGALQARAGRRAGSTWMWVLATGGAVYLASTGLSLLAQRLHLPLQPSNQALIEASLGRNPLLLFVFAVVLAPMYEELLFRRVFFARLWQAGQPLLGTALSAALFALMHELPGVGGKPLAGTLVLWLAYGFMGLAFAWVYRRTGTLWAAVAAHALNNALALILGLAFGGQ
ncbi:MAG: CPBP family intramembrane metalloprotease [Pseudoxanthomonas sp.]